MQLSDEVAEEVMREAARAKLERCLATALQNVKTRTKKSDYTPAIQVLRLCCPCLEAEVFRIIWMALCIDHHHPDSAACVVHLPALLFTAHCREKPQALSLTCSTTQTATVLCARPEDMIMSVKRQRLF